MFNVFQNIDSISQYTNIWIIKNNIEIHFNSLYQCSSLNLMDKVYWIIFLQFSYHFMIS